MKEGESLTSKFYNKLVSEEESEIVIGSQIKPKLSQATSKAIEICLPNGLYTPFPKNMMSSMVLAGAKGSLVNHSQISIMLGQQELEGKRVAMTPAARTLPCFRIADPRPRAYGYVTDRFLSGIRPQEYFFHSMAGREGLIDTVHPNSMS